MDYLAWCALEVSIDNYIHIEKKLFEDKGVDEQEMYAFYERCYVLNSHINSQASSYIHEFDIQTTTELRNDLEKFIQDFCDPKNLQNTSDMARFALGSLNVILERCYSMNDYKHYYNKKLR